MSARALLGTALLLSLAAPLGGVARGEVRNPGASIPAMMFAGIEPSTAAPGERVTITGLQFMTGARVWLGGQEATDVQVETPERLTATVPQGGRGKVAVMIRNPDGREVARGRSFTYRQ